MPTPPSDTTREFDTGFALGTHKIGSGEPVFVIAEAGVSHFGDPGKARDLVDLAADAGADALKTQAFVTDELVSSASAEWRGRLRPKEVGFSFLAKMKERCDARGILFLCTAHDLTALEWLDDLGVLAFKIGSGERGNTPFLREIAKRGKPIILSTGMYEERHILEVLETFRQERLRRLALLHCVTSYPTPPAQVNLAAMQTIIAMFEGPVGYSDHTSGNHAVLAAVARGARIIEKHIALDFDVPNAQDWRVAAGPDDFPQLVDQIREVEAMIGTGNKRPQPCEEAALDWALKSLVATADLVPGTVLTREMIAFKRPGNGLPPSALDRVLGRRLTVAIAADGLILEENLES